LGEGKRIPIRTRQEERKTVQTSMTQVGAERSTAQPILILIKGKKKATSIGRKKKRWRFMLNLLRGVNKSSLLQEGKKGNP